MRNINIAATSLISPCDLAVYPRHRCTQHYEYVPRKRRRRRRRRRRWSKLWRPLVNPVSGVFLSVRGTGSFRDSSLQFVPNSPPPTLLRTALHRRLGIVPTTATGMVWCASGVRVVRCGVRVVCEWCARGVRVVCAWCARGVHVVWARCARGVRAVCAWCACSVCYGVRVVCAWCERGVRVVRAWCARGVRYGVRVVCGLMWPTIHLIFAFTSSYST